MPVGVHLLSADFQMGCLRRDWRVTIEAVAVAAMKNGESRGGINLLVPGGVGIAEGVIAAMGAGNGDYSPFQGGQFDLEHFAVRISSIILQFIFRQGRIVLTSGTPVTAADGFALAAEIDGPRFRGGWHGCTHFL